MQSVAVAVKRCLRPYSIQGVCRKQLLIPCAQYGVQALPGHRLFSLICFLLVLWCFPLLWLAVPWSSEQRTPSCTTATFSGKSLPRFFARSADNLLLRLFSPSLGYVSVSAPVVLSLTFPRLLVLRLGLNSHPHKLGGFTSSLSKCAMEFCIKIIKFVAVSYTFFAIFGFL